MGSSAMRLRRQLAHHVQAGVVGERDTLVGVEAVLHTGEQPPVDERVGVVGGGDEGCGPVR